MLAAAFSYDSSTSSNLKNRVDVEKLTVLDDPQEWEEFSRPCDDLLPVFGQWESHVTVGGMHCVACSLAVEQALLSCNGVLAAQVSAASGRASVVWSAALTRPSMWMGVLLTLGYPLQPASDALSPNADRQETKLALWRWLVAGFCMMQVMMYAAPSYFSSPGDITPDIEKLLRWASWVLSLPVVFFSCGPFFRHAFSDLKQLRISMELPVALGIIITFAVSTAATFEPSGWLGGEVYFDSLTMFVFFLLTGRWLEIRLREKTAGALGRLMQRLPDGVERQLTNGQFEYVAVRRLIVGDVICVRQGEAFPADGTIVVGDTFTDEALLTGESRPVHRAMGDIVLAGSYNVSAVVQVRVDQIGKSTRYAQIVMLMERASLDKPRLALLADRVAKPFLAFVILAAIFAAAFWWNTDPARAMMAAVAVLVVTCPCALSLATPAAMLTTAGQLARHGVLVRRLQAIENLAEVDTVVFDKTGTLTDPSLNVCNVHAYTEVTNEQALKIAAALGKFSLHPVSRALVFAAESLGESDAINLMDIKEFAGMGLQGRLTFSNPFYGLEFLRLGSARFCGVEDTASGLVSVYLTDASGVIARFDLNETIRPGAKKTVEALQASGIDVQMLSGDRIVSAQRIADQLGIRKVQGDCTPQSKLKYLRALQDKGCKVMMVGDGLNDGPVLAGAHVSMAVGSAVPLAQAQADFVMPGVQLLMLPGLLLQATRTVHVVRQNLWWAALYNAVCVPLALSGWLPAWLAGLGMAMSSLLVIANAARLANAKAKV